MANLTKSEWAIFLLNIVLAVGILIGITWTLLTEPKKCWSDTATETQNLINCEGR
jgi:hypothetical protein